MSANQWSTCPNCTRRCAICNYEAVAQADKLYGKIPLAEWKKKQKELDDALELSRSGARHRTFREDWEIYGAESGTVTIEYRGVCDVCGAVLSVHEEYPILGADG